MLLDTYFPLGVYNQPTAGLVVHVLQFLYWIMTGYGRTAKSNQYKVKIVTWPFVIVTLIFFYLCTYLNLSTYIARHYSHQKSNLYRDSTKQTGVSKALFKLQTENKALLQLRKRNFSITELMKFPSWRYRGAPGTPGRAVKQFPTRAVCLEDNF